MSEKKNKKELLKSEMKDYLKALKEYDYITKKGYNKFLKFSEGILEEMYECGQKDKVNQSKKEIQKSYLFDDNDIYEGEYNDDEQIRFEAVKHKYKKEQYHLDVWKNPIIDIYISLSTEEGFKDYSISLESNCTLDDSVLEFETSVPILRNKESLYADSISSNILRSEEEILSIFNYFSKKYNTDINVNILQEQEDIIISIDEEFKTKEDFIYYSFGLILEMDKYLEEQKKGEIS
jgi:hypothetical protein